MVAAESLVDSHRHESSANELDVNENVLPQVDVCQCSRQKSRSSIIIGLTIALLLIALLDTHSKSQLDSSFRPLDETLGESQALEYLPSTEYLRPTNKQSLSFQQVSSLPHHRAVKVVNTVKQSKDWSRPITSTIEATSLSTASSTMICNGLASNCDLRVSQLMFATMHNAMSTKADGYLFFNHIENLESALSAGFRGINVDIGKCFGQVKLVHSFCILGTRDPVQVFTDIRDFLYNNPYEVLIMPTQIYDTKVGLDEIYNVMQSVEGFTDLLYIRSTTSTDWPTLRELITNGQRILFFHYNGPTCDTEYSCPPGLNYWFDYAGETPFEYTNIDEVNDVSNSCRITRGNPTAFVGLNLFLELPSQRAADYLNSGSFLENYLQTCDLNVNLLLVDFWSAGSVVSIVQEYNQKAGLNTVRKE